jgi:hypothetical protein
MILHVKSTNFWDLPPYSLVEFYIGFGGTYFHHLKARRVKQVTVKRQVE